MAGYGLGPLPAGQEISQFIKAVISLRDYGDNFVSQDIQDQIKGVVDSCQGWAQAFQLLCENVEPLDNLVGKRVEFDGEMVNSWDLLDKGPEGVEKFEEMHRALYEKMAENLKAGKVVIAEMKLPLAVDSIHDHYFTLEPVLDGTHVRCFHGWQGRHEVLSTEPIPIDDMVNSFNQLTSYDWDPNTGEVDVEGMEEAFKNIFGEQDKEVAKRVIDEHENTTQKTRKRPVFGGHSGEPTAVTENPEDYCEEIAKMVNKLNETWFYSPEGELLYRPDFHDTEEGFEPPEAIPAEEYEAEFGACKGVAMGSLFGLVFGAGTAILQGDNLKGVMEEGLKGLIAGGIGDASAYAVKRKFGESVLRDNVVTAVAMTVVFTVWDVHKWEMHEITKVEFREHLAQGIGGAVGGVFGAAAAGAAVGEVATPIGAVIGFFAGLIGGVIGANVGSTVDHWIWDQGEDDIMNCYEFFGWDDVERDTRPEKSAEEFGEAFDTALHEKKHEDVAEDHWHVLCLRNFMVLVNEMYPESKELMEKMENVAQASVENIPFALVSSASANVKIIKE